MSDTYHHKRYERKSVKSYLQKGESDFEPDGFRLDEEEFEDEEDDDVCGLDREAG
jgi:hypothetical protein